ncbi:MAG: hypothetical protein JNM13_09730 [Hyphomicrobiaceae bacterium]|nr:hypothetical protein [Hyphomicrobiaceae bacterium]
MQDGYWQQLQEQLLKNLSSPEWLAGELTSWLVFSFLVALLVWLVETGATWIATRQYTGWRLIIVGFGDEPQKIAMDDVQRFLTSDFELHKFIKSTCSSICQIKTRTLKDALGTWAFMDTAAKIIRVDFTRIPSDQVGSWHYKPADRKE